MANKRFISYIKQLFKGQSHDSEWIWRSLEEAEGAYNVHYLSMQIYLNLINSYKKKDISYNHEALLSTLFILQFYKDIKPKPSTLIEECQKLLGQRKMQMISHQLWVMEIYLDSSLFRDFTTMFIAQAVQSPRKIQFSSTNMAQQFEDGVQEIELYRRQLEFMRNEKYYKCMKHLSFPPEYLVTKAGSFWYECFLDHILNKGLRIEPSVYVYLKNLLIAAQHAVAEKATISRAVILLFYILENFIKFYGCTDKNVLKDLTYLTSQFRNLPGTVGSYGVRLFKILHKYIKLSGSAFRTQLRSSYPYLDSKVFQRLEFSKFIVGRGGYLFVTPYTCHLNNLRKLIVFHVLATSRSPLSEKRVNFITAMDASMCFKVYMKIIKMLDAVVELEDYTQIDNHVKGFVDDLFDLQTSALNEPSSHEDSEDVKQLKVIRNPQHPFEIFKFPVREMIHASMEELCGTTGDYSLIKILRAHANDVFSSNGIELCLFGSDEYLGRWVNQLGMLI